MRIVVRRAAASALRALVKAAPALAPEALPALLAALKDEDSDVRRAAASALRELVKAAPGPSGASSFASSTEG
jgi:HEAT repeat protein